MIEWLRSFWTKHKPTHEAPVLSAYSNPDLRRSELTRRNKKLQLSSIGITGERAEEILDSLYPPTKEN